MGDRRDAYQSNFRPAMTDHTSDRRPYTRAQVSPFSDNREAVYPPASAARDALQRTVANHHRWQFRIRHDTRNTTRCGHVTGQFQVYRITMAARRARARHNVARATREYIAQPSAA